MEKERERDDTRDDRYGDVMMDGFGFYVTRVSPIIDASVNGSAGFDHYARTWT